MVGSIEDRNRRMLQARDRMDRAFAEPLDVAGLARSVHLSPAHFSRTFRDILGESPSAYRERFRAVDGARRVPACWVMSLTRPV